MKLNLILFTIVFLSIIQVVYSEACYCLNDCIESQPCDFYDEQPSNHDLCPDVFCGALPAESCEEDSDCLATETDDGIDYITPGSCTEYECIDDECVVERESYDSCSGPGLWEKSVNGIKCKSTYRSCPNECWNRYWDQGTCYEDENEEGYCLCYNQRIISLEKGWNMISNPFGEVYDISSGNCDISASLYGYENGLVPKSELTEMDAGKGYLVKLSSGCSLFLDGNEYVDSIELKTGWNMIGTVNNEEMSISDIEDKCELISSVYTYDNDKNSLKTVDETLEVGIGYLVKVVEDCTIG